MFSDEYESPMCFVCLSSPHEHFLACLFICKPCHSRKTVMPSYFRCSLKGKAANLVLVQAQERKRQKKKLQLNKLYENLETRVVPDLKVNHDLKRPDR